MSFPRGHRHRPEPDTEHTEPAAHRPSRIGVYAPAFIRRAKCNGCRRTIQLVPEDTNRQAYWRAV